MLRNPSRHRPYQVTFRRDVETALLCRYLRKYPFHARILLGVAKTSILNAKNKRSFRVDKYKNVLLT